MDQNENNRDVQPNSTEPAPANQPGSWTPPDPLRVIRLLSWTQGDSNLIPDTVAMITFIATLPEHGQGPVPISRENLTRNLGLTAERIEAAEKNAVEAGWLSIVRTDPGNAWYMVTIPEHLTGFLQETPRTLPGTAPGYWKWIPGHEVQPREAQCTSLPEAKRQVKQLVAELLAGNDAVARLKANLPAALKRISEGLPHAERIELANLLYWALPTIPAAAIATLLPGATPRSVYLYLTNVRSGVFCCKCGTDIIVGNRKSLAYLRRVVENSPASGHLMKCHECYDLAIRGNISTRVLRG